MHGEQLYQRCVCVWCVCVACIIKYASVVYLVLNVFVVFSHTTTHAIHHLPTTSAQGTAIGQHMLKGEVLWSGSAPELQLKRFRAADLPADPAARFDVLFQERPLWLWDDLEPYVSSMAVCRGGSLCTRGGMATMLKHTHTHTQGNAEAVLLKYARLVQPHADAPVQYTRR